MTELTKDELKIISAALDFASQHIQDSLNEEGAIGPGIRDQMTELMKNQKEVLKHVVQLIRSK